MATNPARRTGTTDTRSAGGKITRNRRPPASSRTPYTRPSLPEEEEVQETQNPNWLYNLIYPAKAVVSGVAKIWSFFDDDASSSSEDDSVIGADDDELDEAETDDSDKFLSRFSKSDKKQIEQLVKEETFSREEANYLIKLVDSCTMDRNGNIGVNTPPGKKTTVMEARKWLQEKRSSSKIKLEAELDLTSSQLNRSEKGSLADVAKSYMQKRPAWASPSFKQVDLGSPSTLGKLHFKEETPKSTLRSSELKRTSFTSGSWNLLEEIRRVRSKASEELLAATPLTETNFSLFSKNDPAQDILESKGDEEAGPSQSTLISADNVPKEAAESSLLRVNQDGDAIQSVELQHSLEDVDLKSNTDVEVNELRSVTPEINGFVCSASGIDAAEKTRLPKGENGLLVGSSHVEQDIYMDNSNLPAESPDVVPRTNPTDAVVNGSQNSSSLQEDASPQELSQPIVDSPASVAKDVMQEKKRIGYARRGRGRGK